MKHTRFQAGERDAGAGPEESHEDAWKTGALLLQGQAGLVQLVERRALERPHCNLPVLEGSL